MEASEEFATRFLSAITERFDEATLFPFSGATRFYLADGLRVIFKDNYAIYYLPSVREIVVVRVLHGSRDIDGIVADGGFR
ncbi:type II toxin-antitoxin system RelE/ParE family toxin [Acidicapsa ligni]|uniref:type II toxin-antitoxin system RelE/ParE family toxin n=1 Tax=Acidicapsa ligni TaxID=542300 RepID=UPI0037BFA850